ncbi:MAG: hypothetical protein WC521_09150 [Bdellovibrionales bacterium]|jgi:hypothetical protein
MKTSPLFRYKNLPLLIALCLVSLQGCSTSSPGDAFLDAAESTFERQEITAGTFRLTVFSRIQDANQPITVYIEGDVRGWTPMAALGVDATPDEYLGLRLATLDPTKNVVVISHPCQFNINDPACHNKTWKNGRLATQIYDSINRALDYVVSVIPRSRLNLVGYSGGGAIAAVMAARRRDVVSLRTIAGNLDPDGNGRTHSAVPQYDYIDPMEGAPRLSMLPQEHFVGENDALVPSFLTGNFVRAVGQNICVKITPIADATHKTGWEEAWKDNVERLPTCAALPRK